MRPYPKICVNQTYEFGLIYSSRVQLYTEKGDDEKQAKEGIALVDFSQRRCLEGTGRHMSNKSPKNSFLFTTDIEYLNFVKSRN